MRDYRITLEDALSVFKGLKQNVERLISSGYIQAFQDCVDDLDITLGVNEQLRAKIDELKGTVNTFKVMADTSNVEWSVIYEKLEKENNKLKERNEYLEEAENEYADKCEEKYMLNKQLKAKVDELEELLIVQGKDYASLEKDIDKYESIIKGLKTQNEQLEEESKTIANNDSIAKITKEFMELYNSSTKKTEETEEKSNKGTHKMILRRM